MHKIDLKKDLKHLYQPSAKAVVEVQVPAFNYLMVDGEGDPNTAQAYAEAVEALFAVSYTAKFMVKKGPLQTDYAVMPLEGLWWADDMATFGTADKSNWKWTSMIMQPPVVSPALVEAAMDEVRCAQVLHIGPFSEEGPTIERLHHFIDQIARRSGKHHEIYLSDIRRADPAKWKTIIRQPMR